MGNSSAKGFQFERDQARLLSLWASGGKSKDLLWRTGMSGGRHTIGALKDHGFGDLQVLKPTPEAIQFSKLFCVELKHYKTFELFTEWYNPKSNLAKWWAKLCSEAKANRVMPMLTVKPNLKPAVVFFDQNQLMSSVNLTSLTTIPRSIILHWDNTFVIGFVQSEFLEAIKLSDFAFTGTKRRPA